MRQSWLRWVALIVVVILGFAIFNQGSAPSPTPTPTATLTPRSPTRTPQVPTATPMPVETEVREGIYFSAVTLTQPDIPSGVGVTLPSVSADGTVLYTYDGNILSFTAAIESDAEIFFPLRVEVQDTADDAVLASVDVTAPNATTASVTLAWDTFNTAWASDGTMLGARNIVVRLLDEAGETLDSANFTLTVRPRPVVLVHGWNSTEGMWSSYAGYLSSAADGWLGLPANNLSTGGGGRPFHDAKWNADKLHEFVTEQRETLDAAHIDLVGHSMGGLIGRAYLQAHGERDVDGQPVALRLITLGTPNTGSPCGNVGAVLSVFSSQLDGAWHFTPAYMRTFNQTVTDTHGTMIHALAGTSVWTCGIEGDGVVPVNSATAYGLDNKISVFTAHIPGVEIWERVFGARDFEYSETQFNEFVIGQLRAAWTPDAPLRLDAQVATAEESDAPPVTQRYTLTIPAGSLAVMTVNAFDGEDLGVLIAPVSGITAELRAPDGAVLVSLDQDDMESLPMGILPHEDATAGTYTVHFANTGTQTATIEMVVFESGLSYVLEIDILPQPDGKTLITATVLQNGTPIPNVSIVAHLDRIEDEESAQPYDLTDGAEEVIGVSADGVHTALLDLPAGVYALAVKAQTNRYSLTESHTFTVADAETGD